MCGFVGCLSPKRLLRELSAEEWQGWIRFNEEEPLGEWRADLRTLALWQAILATGGAKIEEDDIALPIFPYRRIRNGQEIYSKVLAMRAREAMRAMEQSNMARLAKLRAKKVEDADAAARKGIESFRSFWETLTPDQRERLEPQFSTFEAMAYAADRLRENGELGEGEASDDESTEGDQPPAIDTSIEDVPIEVPAELVPSNPKAPTGPFANPKGPRRSHRRFGTQG